MELQINLPINIDKLTNQIIYIKKDWNRLVQDLKNYYSKILNIDRNIISVFLIINSDNDASIFIYNNETEDPVLIETIKTNTLNLNEKIEIN